MAETTRSNKAQRDLHAAGNGKIGPAALVDEKGYHTGTASHPLVTEAEVLSEIRDDLKKIVFALSLITNTDLDNI